MEQNKIGALRIGVRDGVESECGYEKQSPGPLQVQSLHLTPPPLKLWLLHAQLLF